MEGSCCKIPRFLVFGGVKSILFHYGILLIIELAGFLREPYIVAGHKGQPKT
jgi:hypothetical protein